MDTFKRNEVMQNMSLIDKRLEQIDSLSDKIRIYRDSITHLMRDITTDSTLKAQIIDSMQLET